MTHRCRPLRRPGYHWAAWMASALPQPINSIRPKCDDGDSQRDEIPLRRCWADATTTSNDHRRVIAIALRWWFLRRYSLGCRSVSCTCAAATVTFDTSHHFGWLSLEGHELNLAVADAMDPPTLYGNRNTIVANRRFVDTHARCVDHLSRAHMVPLWPLYYFESISTARELWEKREIIWKSKWGFWRVAPTKRNQSWIPGLKKWKMIVSNAPVIVTNASMLSRSPFH